MTGTDPWLSTRFANPVLNGPGNALYDSTYDTLAPVAAVNSVSGVYDVFTPAAYMPIPKVPGFGMMPGGAVRWLTAVTHATTITPAAVQPLPYFMGARRGRAR